MKKFIKQCGLVRLTMVASAVVMLLINVFASSAYAANVIKVGFIDSLSGPISSLGIPYEKGLKAAMLYQDKVDGTKIKVFKLDDGSDPSKAARAASKLINEKHVDIIIGTAGSPGSLAIAAVTHDSKTPYISLAQAKLPKGQDRSWLVNIPQPATLMFDSLAKYMKNQGVKTIGYIGFSDSWGDTAYRAIKKDAAKYGMKIVADQRYARSDTSVTGQVLKVMAKHPDAIMTGTSGTPGALPYLELAKRHYKGQIYGGHSLISSHFIEVGGSAVEGMVAPTGPVTVADQLPVDYPTRKIGLEFRKVYKKANGEAPNDAFSAYSFDAWIVFVDAASRVAGKATPGTSEYRLALRNALNSGKEVVGTQGVYNFTPDKIYGVDDRAAVVVKLENAHWKLLESNVVLKNKHR